MVTAELRLPLGTGLRVLQAALLGWAWCKQDPRHRLVVKTKQDKGASHTVPGVCERPLHLPRLFHPSVTSQHNKLLGSSAHSPRP